MNVRCSGPAVVMGAEVLAPDAVTVMAITRPVNTRRPRRLNALVFHSRPQSLICDAQQ